MTAFSSSLEHVLAELERIDLLVRLHVVRARQIKPTDDRFEGLYLSAEEIDALMEAPVGLPRWARVPLPRGEAEIASALEEIAASVQHRAEASLTQGVRLRLEEFTQLFELDAFDREVVLVGLAPEIDLRYEKFFAYLQDDVTRRRPTVDLVLNVLCPSFEAKLEARSRFLPASPLLRHRLIELFDDNARPMPPLLGKHFRLSERIASFLLGADPIDSAILPMARLCAPRRLEELPLPPRAIEERMKRIAREAMQGQLLLQLRGASGVGKKTWAERLCAELGLKLLVVDAERLVSDNPPNVESLVALAIREAKLQGAALYWDGFDSMLAEERRSVQGMIEQSSIDGGLRLAIVAGSASWEPRDPDCLRVFRRVDIPSPTHVERARIWAESLGDLPERTAAELPAVAGKFRLAGGEIIAAAAAAQSRARQDGRHEPTSADLHAACRARSSLRLGNLARKIEPIYAFGDLVLPAAVERELRALCDQVRFSGQVLEDWGFGRKLARGRGVAALFAGPSGTGKTMAAEVIAGDLGLDLYAIDLSSVVSKYIGETEKNLGRIFAEAEASNAILFFDEADALFGQRSEVKDAHDRYANLETSYLLQKMEEYPGVSILATNLRRNMDNAFVRRMAFTVTFPLPEEQERLLIWTKVWPEAVPLGADVDLGFMAKRFEFAGGNIKNIALGAAYLAAAEGSAVSMRHLVGATRRELEKMGKSWAPEEFGRYEAMLEK